VGRCLLDAKARLKKKPTSTRKKSEVNLRVYYDNLTVSLHGCYMYVMSCINLCRNLL
jgi:hypothetical protein